MAKEKPEAPAPPDAEFPESTSLYGQGYRQGLRVGHAEGRAEGVIEGRRQINRAQAGQCLGCLLLGAAAGALAMWAVALLVRGLAALLA